MIGGFIPGPHGVDSIIVGYYRDKDLVYVARVRNGFVPATRRVVYEKLKPPVTDKCPFVNLPETGRARWGEILDAEKMKKCIWLRPKLVAVVEFLEWTEADRLRHSKFVALRGDKNPREVVKEVKESEGPTGTKRNQEELVRIRVSIRDTFYPPVASTKSTRT